MSVDNSNNEFEGKNLPEKKDDKPHTNKPEQEVGHATSNRQTAQENPKEEAEEAARVRAELQGQFDKWGSDWKVEEKRIIEYEKAFGKTLGTTVRLFNERVLKSQDSQKQETLLKPEELEALKSFKLSASFHDTEKDQRWQVIVDTLSKGNDTEGPGTRITIWDKSKRGRRALNEWPDESMEQYGDVHSNGWRMNKGGMYDFDSRHNSDISWLPFLRESQPTQIGQDTLKITKVNTLLTRAIEHPELVKLTRHKVIIPGK